jgi:NADH-quinone oxidoreductase subunit G
MRNGSGFEAVSWSKALTAVAEAFSVALSRGEEFGVIGSNHTTNEENFVLQKLARHGLRTNNIDHHRTGDIVTLLRTLRGRAGGLATTADLYTSPAILVVGSDLAQQHSFLSFQIRANCRHHQSHIYVVTPGPVREDQYATRSIRIRHGEEIAAVVALREQLRLEPALVVLFGDAIKGAAVDDLVEFGDSLGIPVKYVCLLDYSNSRGASDMGLLPDLLPGYRPLADVGLDHGRSLPEILEARDLGVLWIVGANPLRTRDLAAKGAFIVVQDLFLTETAKAATVVLPAASVYEKEGTVTNVCGEVQQLRRALRTMGTKSDLEIFGLLAKHMRLNFRLGDSEQEV